jgi:hypothetical protein
MRVWQVLSEFKAEAWGAMLELWGCSSRAMLWTVALSSTQQQQTC